MFQVNHYGGIRAVYGEDELLKKMSRIAERNKKMVKEATKDMAKKMAKEDFNPFVEHSKATR